MHTIIPPTVPFSRSRAVRYSTQSDYRQPNYDCRELPDAVKLAIYIPGVRASDIAIDVHGADLVVTARKPHLVRANWQALHLEKVQRDYRLRLRLGNDLDYGALHAELHEGVLMVGLPKRQPSSTESPMLNVA